MNSSLRRVGRALPGMFRVGFSEAVAYRGELLVWVLTTNMPLVMLALWTAVAREAPVGRFGQRDFAAYFLATLVVRLLTGSWVVWQLNMEIRDGSLAMRLLRPMHPLLAYAVENLAALPLKALIVSPVVVVLGVIDAGHLPSDLVQWCVLPWAIAGAFALGFCVMALIGALGLFVESSLGLYELWMASAFVLSGYMVPLELFPAGIYRVVRWLPFRYTLGFPVESAIGLIDRRGALVGLAVQWGYVALFGLCALALFQRGLRRFAAYGG